MVRCNYNSSGTERNWLLRLPLTSSWYNSPKLFAVCCGVMQQKQQRGSVMAQQILACLRRKQIGSHRALADAILNLCLARKSVWDAWLIVGTLSVLSLLLNSCCLLWPWSSSCCFLFSTRSYSHWLCTYFCVWQHNCVPVHRCKSRLHPNTHQGETPLPPCPTFCTEVGTWTKAATLPKW